MVYGRSAVGVVGEYQALKRIGASHGYNNVYKSFVAVYNATTASYNNDVLSFIASEAMKYGNDAALMKQLLNSMYYAMVKEESSKDNTRPLGKRVKRLAVHNLLMENQDAETAANFMKGLNRYSIGQMCSSHGF